MMMQGMAIWMVQKSMSTNNHPTKTKNDGEKSAVRRKGYNFNQFLESLFDVTNDRVDADLLQNVQLASLETEILSKFSIRHAKSCRWYRRNSLAKLRIVWDDHCDPPFRTSMVWYNPLDHDRWLDFTPQKTHKVPSRGYLRIRISPNTSQVDIPPDWELESRLLPNRTIPSMQTISRMPPIQISIEGDPGFLSDIKDVPLKDFPCDVPCETRIPPNLLMADYSIVNTPWIVRYSMESAQNYESLAVDPEGHRNNLFFATTSFRSEIPLPYFSWAEYQIQTPPVQYDQVIAGASFLASHCESKSGREAVVEELTRMLRIDSLGECMKNAEPPPGASLDDTLSIKQKYLFHLSFENSIEEDCKFDQRCKRTFFLMSFLMGSCHCVPL
jgi:Glycosyltransferase family 10 (fucosyltransferase) C-term